MLHKHNLPSYLAPILHFLPFLSVQQSFKMCIRALGSMRWEQMIWWPETLCFSRHHRGTDLSWWRHHIWLSLSHQQVLPPEIPVPRGSGHFSCSPLWKPKVNLNPMANHLRFQAFQRRANPETQTTMMNQKMGLQPYPSTPAANTTVWPTNLFVGGFFPARHAYEE